MKELQMTPEHSDPQAANPKNTEWTKENHKIHTELWDYDNNICDNEKYLLDSMFHTSGLIMLIYMLLVLKE